VTRQGTLNTHIIFKSVLSDALYQKLSKLVHARQTTACQSWRLFETQRR